MTSCNGRHMQQMTVCVSAIIQTKSGSSLSELGLGSRFALIALWLCFPQGGDSRLSGMWRSKDQAHGLPASTKCLKREEAVSRAFEKCRTVASHQDAHFSPLDPRKRREPIVPKITHHMSVLTWVGFLSELKRSCENCTSKYDTGLRVEVCSIVNNDDIRGFPFSINTVITGGFTS